VGFQREKSLKLVIFGIYFPQRDISPSSIFTKLGVGEGLPSPHNHANFHLRGFRNVALRQPNFWYKFAPKKKSRGSIEKVEYRCTTRNLPLCNGTIIVLKITLLHGDFVITNFVIPKRDKKNKKNKQKTSHFFVYSRRATQDPHHTWHGDRRGPSHFCTPLTFF